MAAIAARGVPRKGRAPDARRRPLHSHEGSRPGGGESPFLGRLTSPCATTVSRHCDEGEGMGGCGMKRRAFARRLVTLAVASVLAALLVGVSWGASYSPDGDPYSLANVTLGTGAQAWWSAGYTGKGVDVALIDSGVSPVAGLDARGKVVNGPDLSLDSQSPSLRYLDAYGHGTFMAGLIAGKDSALTGGPSVYRG